MPRALTGFVQRPGEGVYLFDANVLITAHRDYYPPDRVPEFWDWLAHHGSIGNVKTPPPVWDEIKPHDEDLKSWLRDHEGDFVLAGDDSDIRVSEVLACYAEDLSEAELEQIGKDPFLIACALHHGGTVVSKEGSKPARTRANRQIPDVGADLGILCITDHTLIRELDFRTNWQP